MLMHRLLLLHMPGQAQNVEATVTSSFKANHPVHCEFLTIMLL